MAKLKSIKEMLMILLKVSYDLFFFVLVYIFMVYVLYFFVIL